MLLGHNPSIKPLITFSICAAISTISPFVEMPKNEHINYHGSVYNQTAQCYVGYYASGKERDDYMGPRIFLDLAKISNLDKISKMAAFEPNWNGNGGLAFTCGAVQLFRDIIEQIGKQPQIAPTGRNSLLLQYELDDKSVLAFEVKEASVDEVYIPQGNLAAAECNTFQDDMLQKISDRVGLFYGSKQN